jgi:hypothetical protein
MGVTACSAPDERIALRPLALAVAAEPPPLDPAPPAPPAPSSVSGPRALVSASSMIELAVAGHLPALAMLPVGVAERRPVAVVTHGNWGGPQWDCPLWRGILGGGVFILCPRGVPRPDQAPPATPAGIAYTYDSAADLVAEIDAGLDALRAAYGAWMEEGPVLYAGCSRGAFLGASIGPANAARFPRLALIEGGHDPWTPAAIKRFADGGGQRVLFTCGQGGCYEAANAKARLLRAAGVEASVAYAPFMGHVCHDKVAEETRRAMPWLMTGDRRWEAVL